MRAALHIGIVGCSAEGAALCYRTVCEEGARWLGPHGHPEVSLHTPSLRRYVDCLERGDLPGVAALMLESAHKLAAAGADLLICPDNTLHQAFDWVRPHTPRPWLHIAEVVAEAARERGFQCLGLTGTRWLLDSEVYPQALAAQGLRWVRPAPEVRAAMGQLIMDELVRGVQQPSTVQRFQAWVQDLQQQGCDAVVLGCTEIPLILNDHNSALPTLDSTRLLARAALRQALGPEPRA